MSNQLTDRFGRNIEYVRLSVTDRCDLRCFYCMPKGFRDFEEPAEWLTFDEIERLIGAFARLGTRRVRLTGGEPLVRRNLPELAGRLTRVAGIEDLSMSTNATRLDKHAEALRAAGVSRINVSLDTLKPEVFKQITGGKLEKVMGGLMAAKAAGYHPIKINMVVMKGVNEDEVEDMVDFCIEHDFTLRFIETMPVGDTGREASGQYVDLQEVKARLSERFELLPGVMPGGGPARYVQVAGTDLRIGFITPISQHFCETCNRVRLAVDGTLYMCLGQEHSYDFKPLLRNGAGEAELEAAIRAAIELKPERHEFREKPDQVIRFMSMTGG
ncbi:GTP 3',8-cyclase 1 [Thiohalobacter sp. COW1]|uniref:GTP 3',8-cyclase n=1 Tax=Thiohalobacter thiocyanaticus TaxID=585455 RepID=A0A1Z4VN18_9GAMM|nr:MULTISPECIES: GTP 3',8-cyclase MoaA [Thiohalobacter]BAZ92893.1 molybdenum cofactor biosynthesis protein A [Thiohalobacter thiocyanaticus]BCO32146.1 GTP 3',8-cyclase 1 [Thiohalobacter sp. COW1]